MELRAWPSGGLVSQWVMTAITRRTVAAGLVALPAGAARAKDRMQTFAGFDGAPMAVRIEGAGRPTLLLHGFMSAGDAWFQSGFAQRLTSRGRQVIAPDFRGHGTSAAPDDPAAYPQDALALDQAALIKALGPTDYDLVGYSMGSLVAVRMLALGARPARAVLGGVGAARVQAVTPRDEMFRDGAANGPAAASAGARAIGARIEQGGMKRPAIHKVLLSLGRTSPEVLKTIRTPTLVVCGDADDDNGVAEDLAAALGDARAVRVKGTHASTHGSVAFLDAAMGFLGAPY